MSKTLKQLISKQVPLLFSRFYSSFSQMHLEEKGGGGGGVTPKCKKSGWHFQQTEAAACCNTYVRRNCMHNHNTRACTLAKGDIRTKSSHKSYNTNISRLFIVSKWKKAASTTTPCFGHWKMTRFKNLFSPILSLFYVSPVPMSAFAEFALEGVNCSRRLPLLRSKEGGRRPVDSLCFSREK